MAKRMPRRASSRGLSVENAGRSPPQIASRGAPARDAARREGEARFAALVAEMPGAIAVARLDDGVILAASRDFAERFGYRLEDVVGPHAACGDLGLWSDEWRGRAWRRALARAGAAPAFETWGRTKDGATVAASLRARQIEFDGELCALVELRELEQSDKRAARGEPNAYRDPLTGLPNRALLINRLRQAIGQNQRSGGRVAVCALDLDDFKAVNLRYGRRAGDQVLIEAAKRLAASVRCGDTVARLESDEFAVVLSGLASDEDCQSGADRLRRAASAPYPLEDGTEIAIAASVGAALFPSDPSDPDTLVRHADRAVCAAKQSGGGQCQLYDDQLARRAAARDEAVQRLAQALELGQFRLHYQPQVDCRSGRCVGAEALIRWRHPTLGLLPPAEFLPLIEESELAPRVGAWVIDEALRQIAAWRRDGLDLTVSVNAFARQLLDPGFVASVAAALARRPEAGRDRLHIEIVETAALNDLEAARETIDACRELGVAFSLDDFGTGYSTLAHIRHLPVTEIKIDRSFVSHMLEREDDRAIVEAVIRLAGAFGRTVVAEGVETPAHIARLIELGCDVMQGYALARPMPAEDLPRWVSEFRLDPAWRRTQHSPAW